MSNEITLTPSEYLYGRDLKFLKNVTYQEALQTQLELAEKLLTKLVHEDDMEDDERIKKVQKAIEFNKEKLKEII